jgi:quercetin dioxygenase-like cupin family protein
MVQKTIFRKSLLAANVPARTVTSVEVREITFEPEQETARHCHPCPVMGFIVEGTAVLQLEGQEPQELPAGSAFYEPADTVIRRFDNASAVAPLKFIGYYLLSGPQELIQMLPQK